MEKTGKLKKVLRGIRYFVLGHLVAPFFYDKRYIRGRWFAGRAHGLCALGWEWVVNDARQRFLLHVNTECPFPIAHNATVIIPENVEFHPDDLNDFQSPGLYIQALGKVHIGHGTYIAPNVGIITANHNVYNLDYHDDPKEVYIGEDCWIGMNSVLLPGTLLGNRTIVGAGAVVKGRFPDGNCILAGTPARIVKRLDIKP